MHYQAAHARGQRAPRTEWDGVLVSLAGPAFGLLAILPVVGVWYAPASRSWMIGALKRSFRNARSRLRVAQEISSSSSSSCRVTTFRAVSN